MNSKPNTKKLIAHIKNAKVKLGATLLSVLLSTEFEPKIRKENNGSLIGKTLKGILIEQGEKNQSADIENNIAREV